MTEIVTAKKPPQQSVSNVFAGFSPMRRATPQQPTPFDRPQGAAPSPGVNPAFADRLSAFQGMLHDQYGLDVGVNSEYRSPEQQASLYAQGRTAPGPVVTNAPPGSSYHNYGAAADLSPRNMSEGAAEGVLGRAFAEHPDTGLTWGGTFNSIHDPLHVQLGVPLQQLRMGGY